MYSQLPLIVFTVFIARSFQFEVISTTQTPPKTEAPSASCSALKENNYRLLSLELQNIKFQKYLEDQCKLNESPEDVKCSTNLEKIDELLQKVIQIEQKLDNTQKQTKELIKSLETKLQKIEESIITKPNVNTSQEHQNSSCECSVPFCNIISTENGWTYVLKRFNGSQDFNLSWSEYKSGFGDAKGELWMGLECLYQLTNSRDYELMVNLVTSDGRKASASYKKFQVGPEQDGYRLKVLEGYSGNAGDGLSPLLNMKFTTKDKQNDHNGGSNCAVFFGGGWWFNRCYNGASLLTGTYYKATTDWLPTQLRKIKDVQMKIKPRNN